MANSEPFDRDEMEPVAHVVRSIDTIICPANKEHLYEDTINILNTLLIIAIDTTTSPAERQRFRALLEAAAEDIEVCRFNF